MPLNSKESPKAHSQIGQLEASPAAVPAPQPQDSLAEEISGLLRGPQSASCARNEDADQPTFLRCYVERQRATGTAPLPHRLNGCNLEELRAGRWLRRRA